MEQILFAIKDNYSDLRAKFKELQCFNVCTDKIPMKYINTLRAYRNSYYFTNEKDRDDFENKLYKKYKGEQ